MRKLIINLCLLFISIYLPHSFSQNKLPDVFSQDNENDIIAQTLKFEAAKAFEILQVSSNKTNWLKNRNDLKVKIIEKAKVSFYPDLPLKYKATKTQKLQNYTVKNIYFQTRPNVYATANLYIPNGEGPFPGVVVMMGHSRSGKLYDIYQSLGYTLAKNGYVSLNIDPWGAGERSTNDGDFEYHGSNLGASLMNVGETLMGMQITDNMRAVDLLCSLPYVDSDKIGATGASGGGNQTMWLAAIDERVNAAIPVVSVGTFQSYIMNSNCVCETLIDGLTFTEESSVLGLIAPRALKICNGQKDSNAAFYPQEMLRSYKGAQAIYKYYDAEDNLSNQIFDTPHGYFPEIREAMLGWLDLHLKNIGDGTSKKETDFNLLPESELMVFSKGKRDSNITTTAEICLDKGVHLKKNILLNKGLILQDKREELRMMLKIPETNLLQAHKLTDSGNWERFILETTGGELIPVLLHATNKRSAEYVIICNAEGKDKISEEIIENELNKNRGVCIIDLWGLGENISIDAKRIDGNLPNFHTLSRSALWLGKTTQGIWINQLDIVSKWLSNSFNVQNISINANREVAIASLLFSALENKINKLNLEDLPLSYLFDNDGDIDYFSMAIHIPDILKWGDLSLAAALSNKHITIINPVSISGRKLDEEEVMSFNNEFNYFNTSLRQNTSISFSP